MLVMTRLRIRRIVACGVVACGVVAALSGAAAAGRAQSRAEPQIWRGGFGYTEPPRLPTERTFRGAFNFCRLYFSSNRREKRGWSTDYPGADYNLTVRLGELTKTRVTKDAQGHPEYVVVRPTDAALFQCPMIFAEDMGTVSFSDEDVKSLRAYFEKGGFMFLADYWGRASEEQWEEEISRVLPPEQYAIVELPMTHAVWHTMFDLKAIPPMASLQTWRRTGGVVERFAEDGAAVEVRGISDRKGRLMVVAVHNSDIPDGWEREGEDATYFNLFSPNAYTVAIDAVMYAMTH
jgi:hypothetical protein